MTNFTHVGILLDGGREGGREEEGLAITDEIGDYTEI
jgi:hypothetical protein